MIDMEKKTGDLIVEFYEAALKEIVERSKMLETPVDLVRKETEELASKKVRELLELNILAEKLTTEYEELNAQIKDKTSTIEKLYGITAVEKSAEAVEKARRNLLEMLDEVEEQEIEAHQKRLSELQEEAVRKEEEVTAEIEQQIEDLKRELNELTKNFEKEFAREAAEYGYKLKRERNAASQRRADEVEERERQLVVREEELSKRKTSVESRIAEIDQLHKAVEEIPAKTENARKAGMKRAEFRVNKAYSHEKTLRAKNRDHKVGALQGQYDHLVEKYKALEAEKESILHRLDECYAQGRMLTSDTVRSIGGINILNGGNADDRI